MLDAWGNNLITPVCLGTTRELAGKVSHSSSLLSTVWDRSGESQAPSCPGGNIPECLYQTPELCKSDPPSLQHTGLGRAALYGAQQVYSKAGTGLAGQGEGAPVLSVQAEGSLPSTHSSTLGQVSVLLKSSVRIHSAAAETHKREQLWPCDRGPQLAVAQQTFLVSQEVLSSPVRPPAPSNAMALQLMVLTPRATRGCP